MKTYFYHILKRAARRWVRRHQPYIIGVTGSIGKTTCRMTITHVLQEMLPDVRIVTSSKNFNSEVGIVLSLFEIEDFDTSWWRIIATTVVILWKALFGGKSYEVIFLEYGIDHPGDMEYLLSIVHPHMSIFTGLDKVHAEYFETIDDILDEKMKLLQGTTEVVFVPATAQYTLSYTQDLESDVLTYALYDNDEADIGFSSHRLVGEDALVYAHFAVHQEQEQLMHIRSNMLGKEYAGYISLGLEIAMILARRLATVCHCFTQESIEITLHQQAGRYTLLAGQFGSILIDSTYNAAPKSMEQVISNTIRLRHEVYPERDMLYCLGDMRELGDFAEEEHRKLASQVAQSADVVYLVGEWMTSVMYDELIKLGYNANDIQCFATSRELGQQVLYDIEHRDRLSLILFKGSQNTIFLEEAIKPILRDSTDQQHLCRQSAWWMDKK